MPDANPASPITTPLDLSVMIPCKNNERTMGRVLESVKGLASQLVVVDSGSTDSTLEMVRAARAWSEVVLVRTHWRGYVRTKQLALESCSKGHILWLDSDEPVSSELAGSVRDAVTRGVEAAQVQRMVEYKGKLLTHAWQPEMRLRLIKRSLVDDGRARFRGTDPHDYLGVYQGTRVETLGGVLIHDSFETFGEHIRNAWRLNTTHAEALYNEGKRTNAGRLVISPASAFIKQLVLKRAFLDGYAGWLAASTSAASTLMKHMMLYERQNADR